MYEHFSKIDLVGVMAVFLVKNFIFLQKGNDNEK